MLDKGFCIFTSTIADFFVIAFKNQKSMKTNSDNSLLSNSPSWLLALLTIIGATVVLFFWELLCRFIDINKDTALTLAYILYGLLLAVGIFFIVRRDPGSAWYVPLICNFIGIVTAIVRPSLWGAFLWGLMFSFIASVIGALMGLKSNARNTGAS
jgi:hypothetical protein